MSKFVAFCMLLVVFMTLMVVGCGIVQSNPSDGKHTGPVTVRNTDAGGYHVEFIRPNNEFFEMLFRPDGTQPMLHKGDVLKDLVYTDGKDRAALFVKAVLDHEGPTPETVPYECFTTSTISSSSNMCDYGNGNVGPCQYTTQKAKK